MRLPLAVSFAVGLVLGVSLLSLPTILGTGPFWDYPRGTVPGGTYDMAEVLVGYTYLVHAPWNFPLLLVANLVPPAGTNILWLDAVPWLPLAGKLVSAAAGHQVNLLGLYSLLCLVAPGMAMTALLGVGGARGVPAAIAGSVIADSSPMMLFEWGHVAAFSYYLILCALLLYALTLARPADRRVDAAWTALLGLAVLSNSYHFVMVGGIWAAGLAQTVLDGRHGVAAVARRAMVAVVVTVTLMAAGGMLSRQLGGAGTDQFGRASLNLAAPFVPQMSGAIPPLAHYRLGISWQVFGYGGLGVLILALAALPALPGWLRRRAGGHAALLALFALFYLLALSDRVFLGGHLLFTVPLPAPLLHALGAFRVSGRFYWPIAFAGAALAIVLVSRHYRPAVAAALLLVAAGAELVDAQPFRSAFAASARAPDAWVLDHKAAEALVAGAEGVRIFPSFGCAGDASERGALTIDEQRRVMHANIELQLLAARRNLPINSVYNARFEPDCAAERAARADRLQPGIAYVYLTPFTPSPAQLDGSGAACGPLGAYSACRVPKSAP